MTFENIDAWWWPYVFILLAGWLTTDFWRFLGVYVGGRMSEDSNAMVLVRTTATALVAAVIGNLVVFPSGALADLPLWIRIGAAATGFTAFLLTRQNMFIGIVVAEAALVAGMILGA